MSRVIKAHELGDEHIGAKIRTTMIGWTLEGELAKVEESPSDYHLYLLSAGTLGAAMVHRDAIVAILEEATIRHPDEPTGLGAVVEADTGEETPAWFVSAVDFQGDVKWIRSEVGLSTWRTWRGIQEDAVAPIRVLSEGVHLSDDDDGDDESETPEKYTVIRPASEGTYHGDDEFEAFKVYEGMTLIDWPEDDEHLRDWVIGDYDGDEWIWKPLPGDQPGAHWRWDFSGFSRPVVSPWKVLRKRDDKEAGK